VVRCQRCKIGKRKCTGGVLPADDPIGPTPSLGSAFASPKTLPSAPPPTLTSTLVAPQLASSFSSPLPTSPVKGIPMDEDRPGRSTTRKRSLAALTTAGATSSAKVARTGASSSGRRGGSVGSSSSVRVAGETSTLPSPLSFPSIPLQSGGPLEEDEITMRLDALEMSIRRGDSNAALQRVTDLRTVYLRKLGDWRA
jgi:hypothetical protein